jgi:hypothetical protein
MYTRNTLEAKKVPELKDICRNYKLVPQGKKQELITKIIEYQEKITQEQIAWEKLMKHGAEERDMGFERVIRVFQHWAEENGFWPAKLSKSGVSYEYIDINEIRAAFADYDPDTSSLREDKLVPTPGTKLEVFLEMLFNERDDWIICDTTNEERDFDCDSEFNDTWLIKGMNELYDREMETEFKAVNINIGWELVIA